MGKGNRNRDNRDVEKIDTPQKVKEPKKHKISKERMKSIIAIAVAVVLVLGIVAAFMASNGTFRRMQILVKSQTGKYNVNRQVATFLAWELEYYSAYVDYMQTEYTDPDASILTQYQSADSFALDYATARVTDDITDSTGAVISTPRNAIDNTLPYMINFVAVCDYAHERGYTVTDEEWQSDFTITWLSGMEDTIPISWNDLVMMQQTYGFASLDLFLDEFFGHGLNAKDVEKALKMICLYEKYMTIYMEEVKAGISDEQLMDYILNNPAYFYTTDYLTYKTDSAELKAKLEAAKDVTEFKRILIEDWFDAKGGYKDAYNQCTTVEEADKLFKTLEKKEDNNEGNAWSDAIQNITDQTNGIANIKKETKTYLVADKNSLNKNLATWLFATHTDFDSEFVIDEDKCYILTITDADTAVVKDSSGAIQSVEVVQFVFEYVDGTSHDGDDQFKQEILKHMLNKLELSSESVTTAYKTASQYAEEYKAVLDALPGGSDISEKMKDYGELMKVENGTSSNSAVPNVIKVKLFASDSTAAAGDIIAVRETDSTAYLVYLKSFTSADANDTDPRSKTWNLFYVEIESDDFYPVLELAVKMAEEEIVSEKTASYNAGAADGSYQKWLFEGVTRENGFSNANRLNSIHVISTTATSAVDNTETTTYDIYMLTKTSHLDEERVVNGAYYVYTGTNKDAALATLAGKQGDDLIAALQSIDLNLVGDNATVNNAVVSETLVADDVDENVAAWLFSDARVANDYTVVTGKDSKTYIAVYLSANTMWETTGMLYLVSENTNNWLAGLKANYKASEFVLNCIGDPAPAAAETTTATTTTTAA